MAVLKEGHVAINTGKIDVSIDFYKKLGGKLEKLDKLGDTNVALMTIGNCTIELIEVPGYTAVADCGIQPIPHLCFRVEDIENAKKELETVGITSLKSEEIVELPLFGGFQNCFFCGPFGETLELIQFAKMI